jgi:Tol biopolymer transport system component
MSDSHRIDRLFAALTDDAWSPPPPAYLDAVLERTRRTRQRRAWASLERWLPVELTFRRPMLAMPMRLLAIVLALLLLLIAAMSVPLLFGGRADTAVVVSPWRNGLIAYGRAGDIWVVDPEVGEPRVLIGGPAADDGPAWSPDGTRIAFVRPQGPGSVLMVADADGSNIRQVTRDPITSLEWYVWSPDGARVAIATGDGRVGTVSMGTSIEDGVFETVPIDRALSMPAWHPDGRSFLVRAETPAGTGLFPVSFPGRTIGRPIRTSDTRSALFTGDRGASDLLEALYSPDGSRIVYVQGQLATDGTYGVFGGPDTRNHVMNADGSNDRVVEFSPTSDYEDGAWFSPDGSRLSMVIREGDFHSIAVMTLDGSRPPVATEPEEDPNAMPAIWSPDGTRILAVRVADGVSYLIDPDTGAKVKQPWLANWADWQRVAP